MQEVFDRVLSDALNASEATVDHSLQSNANKKAAENGGKVQYSKDENYLDVVKSIGNDSGYRSEEAYVKVGDYTPDILIEKAGAKQRPVAIRFDTLYGIIRSEGSIKPLHYHGMGEEFAANLLYYLEDPIKIIKIKNKKNPNKERINAIISYSPKGENSTLFSIEFESSIEYQTKNDIYNLIITAFDANSNYISNIENAKDSTVVYDKKIDGSSQVNRHRYKYVTTINDYPSISIIPDSSEKSKGKEQKSPAYTDLIAKDTILMLSITTMQTERFTERVLSMLLNVPFRSKLIMI